MALLVENNKSKTDQHIAGRWISDRHIYINAAQEKVVAPDNPEAAYLLVAKGGNLSMEQARKLGLLNAETAPATNAEHKAMEPAEDKGAQGPDKKEVKRK